MKKIASFRIYPLLLMGTFLMIIISCKKDELQNGQVKDIDGNVYNTITIGTQVWMNENLRTTKYRDGTSIPNVTDNNEWSNLTSGAYCNNENDPSNSKIYGRLYNWYAVTNTHNICPVGWHVPSDEEWANLIEYLNGISVEGGKLEVGGKLKETGTTHWNSPNTGATNETNFTALPSGIRFDIGGFVRIGTTTSLWSSTEYSESLALTKTIKNDDSGIYNIAAHKRGGYSIRLIKD